MSAAAVDEVRAAIAALSNPQETQTANQWLVALERSVEGWAAAEQLLREPAGSQCRFFGAKFLYSKVQRDSVQLNEGTVPALVHSIVQHILRVAGEAVLDLNVCRYLCLALAALAVQMNQEGIVPQILLWFNPIVASKPRVLLELLVVLPEECYNRQVDVSIDVRDKFAEQLSASIGDVLGFLHVLVTQNVSVNVGVQTEGTTNLILRCLTKWIDHISFSGPLLSTHPLFMYALECLGQEAAFEAATEVVIATLAKFRCREPAVLSLVIPRVLALRDLWASQVHRLTEDSDTEDMNVCRCLCRLFTEAAESCLDVIKDDGRTDLDPLVFQLVECVRFPYDHSIARIPLVFFMEADNMQLSDFMRASAKLHERFITAYVGLYDAALVQLVLPADVIQGFGVSMPDEVVDARIDWKNTVLDCCVVLGPATCVQRACMVLQDQIQAIQARAPSNGGASLAASMGTASQWGRIEAALFSIQTVPSHDNPLFPQLLSLIGSLPSDLRALRTTIIGLFGGLSSWLSRNDNFLPPILAQLYSTLQEGDAPIAAAAAKAIMRIFMASAGVVSLPSTDLHNIMLSMRRAQKLTLDADLMLLEGFCVVVSKLPTEDSKEASFACIVEPIAVALANNVAQAPPPAPSVIAADIDRLTTCFRFVLMDGAVVAKMFAQVQPLLVKVLDAYPGKESLCEKICRCYKHSIRSCRTGFIQILPAMTAHLAEQFRKTPVAAFLYAGAICFSDFAREDNGAHIQLLYTMMWSMSSTFFEHFKSLEDFERRPDVAEEYFYLMAKALSHAPAPFLMSSDGSRVLIDAGVTGLRLQHRDAQKGILMFFEKLIRVPDSDELRRSCASCGVQDVAVCQSAAKALILQCGAPLVSTLCSSLAGVTRAYALDEEHGCAGDVLWNIKLQCPAELQGWLTQAVASFPPMAQMHAAKMNFTGTLLAATSKRDFLRTMDQLLWKCTR